MSKLSEIPICQRLGLRHPIFGVAWCNEETTVDAIMTRLVEETEATLAALPR